MYAGLDSRSPAQIFNDKEGMLFRSPIIDCIRASVPAHSHAGGIDHIQHHFVTALVRIQALITDKFLRFYVPFDSPLLIL